MSPVVVSPEAPVAATILLKSDAASRQALIAAYSSNVYTATRDGRMVLSCRVDAHGLAEFCKVVSEEPPGRECRQVALQMRLTFKLTPAMGPDVPVESTMAVAVEFKAPVAKGGWSNWIAGGVMPIPAGVTMLNSPVWAQAPGFEDLAKAYPDKGGGVEGYALAHRMVVRGGGPTDCTILKESPEHSGFGRAALRLTRQFRVSCQSAQVRRRDPLWVDIPIRLAPPSTARDRKGDAPIWLGGQSRQGPEGFSPRSG